MSDGSITDECQLDLLRNINKFSECIPGCIGKEEA